MTTSRLGESRSSIDNTNKVLCLSRALNHYMRIKLNQTRAYLTERSSQTRPSEYSKYDQWWIHKFHEFFKLITVDSWGSSRSERICCRNLIAYQEFKRVRAKYVIKMNRTFDFGTQSVCVINSAENAKNKLEYSANGCWFLNFAHWEAFDLKLWYKSVQKDLMESSVGEISDFSYQWRHKQIA